MTYRTEDFPDDEQREVVGEELDNSLFASTDEEMRRVLESWNAPIPAGSLDRRIMAAYRKQVPTTLWERAFASSIRVPLPAAAAVILLLTALGLLSFRSIRPVTSLENTNSTPRIQVVEVPVVQEKIVPRVVYVEKKHQIRNRITRRTSHGYMAARTDGEKTGPRAQESGQYVTHADLSGFQPVNQMKIEVIRKEKANEN